jgi:hypothetical protein
MTAKSLGPGRYVVGDLLWAWEWGCRKTVGRREHTPPHISANGGNFSAIFKCKMWIRKLSLALVRVLAGSRYHIKLGLGRISWTGCKRWYSTPEGMAESPTLRLQGSTGAERHPHERRRLWSQGSRSSILTLLSLSCHLARELAKPNGKPGGRRGSASK